MFEFHSIQFQTIKSLPSLFNQKEQSLIPFVPQTNLLQSRHLQTNPIPRPQHQPPHLQTLRILHSFIPFKRIKTQQTTQNNLHLGLRKFPPHTPPRALQERHKRIRRIRLWQILPSIRIKLIRRRAPIHREAINRVRKHVDDGAGRARGGVWGGNLRRPR